MDDLHSRVSVLETKISSIDAELKEIRDDFKYHLKEEKVFHQTINDKLDKMENSLSRYHGIVGGITLTVTAIWAFIGMFKEWVIKQFI